MGVAELDGDAEGVGDAPNIDNGVEIGAAVATWAGEVAVGNAVGGGLVFCAWLVAPLTGIGGFDAVAVAADNTVASDLRAVAACSVEEVEVGVGIEAAATLGSDVEDATGDATGVAGVDTGGIGLPEAKGLEVGEGATTKGLVGVGDEETDDAALAEFLSFDNADSFWSPSLS